MVSSQSARTDASVRCAHIGSPLAWDHVLFSVKNADLGFSTAAMCVVRVLAMKEESSVQ